MITVSKELAALEAIASQNALKNIGLLSMDSLVFSLAAVVLLFGVFLIKKEMKVKVTLFLMSMSLGIVALFMATIPTEASEKQYKQGYKEWQSLTKDYMEGLEEQKVVGIKDVDKLRTLDVARPKSGMTPVKYTTKDGEKVERWVDVVVDKKLEEPYISYVLLEEDLVYDKNLTRLQKGHMKFYPVIIYKGEHEVKLHTNKKP